MHRPTLDVSHVPTVAFGPRTTVWLGFVGVIIVEGMMIALTIVAYFLLGARAAEWPPHATPPALAAGTVNTAVFLLSIAPALWLKRAARRGDLARVRVWLLVLSVIAIATLGVIGWAFATLNTRWDDDAYGSLVWMLLGMYALALIAAALVIWVLAVFMFSGPAEGRRFTNVYEAGDYWLLAIALWLSTWAVIYLAPRWL